MKHDSLYNLLAARFAEAIAEVAQRAPDQTEAALRSAGDPKFGDYQCNAAMSLARALQSKPRDVAQRIKAVVEPRLTAIAEPLEIAGPGFINIRLKDAFLARYLDEIPAPPAVVRDRVAGRPDAEEAPACGPVWEPLSAGFDRLGMPPTELPQRVVVEYSQPNIAKQMHVGHLRSTVIGDVFARVLAFEGHEVIRQNHIGDWGTQFGILLRWYREHPVPTTQTHDDVLDAIVEDYRKANERDKTDEQFATEARLAVGALQSGEPAARRLWEQLCRVSWRGFTEIYERLGVLLRPEDVCGESFYKDRLAPLVQELQERLAPRNRAQNAGEGRSVAGPYAEIRTDQGAVCVFLHDEHGEPLFKNPSGEILPMIIQKSDGAFLYATTDLAAIRFRLQELMFPSGRGANRLIYVTDARQKLHFQMFFATARAANWIAPEQRIEHVTFGTVMGPDRRPLKTREGTPVTLRALIDEAESRALELLERRDQESEESGDRGEAVAAGGGMTAAEKREIARRVGVAAVKYADLRNDRNSDYVFSWDKMISFQGNTAPYMMYAYARIRSIYRKAAERFGSPDVYASDVAIRLDHPAERALALRLARLREAIDNVATDLLPHTLCAYLYDLAGDFMRFYESCPVLQAPSEAERLSRMRLCDLTARTLKLGLSLLGIEVIERM